MNPKTLTVEELYGKYDRVTREWMDGILSSIVRKICSGKYYASYYYISVLSINNNDESRLNCPRNKKKKK